MIKVYISSPYTRGDQAENVKRQMDCANDLIELGYNPYPPLYTHFLHMFHPRDYEKWMELDLDWVLVCDCILRLSGESPGGDREVEYAKRHKIPVFNAIDELHRYWAERYN